MFIGGVGGCLGKTYMPLRPDLSLNLHKYFIFYTMREGRTSSHIFIPTIYVTPCQYYTNFIIQHASCGCCFLLFFINDI